MTQTMRERLITAAAQSLCEEAGHDPDGLEPGNVIIHPLDNLDEWTSAEGAGIDGLADNGTRPPDGHNGKDPCHFMWRGYIAEAQAVIAAILAELRTPDFEMAKAGSAVIVAEAGYPAIAAEAAFTAMIDALKP